LAIYKQARWVARSELKIDPSKLRVIYMNLGEGGCQFYRVVQPVKWLKRLEGSPIHVETSDYMRVGMAIGDDFDVIVAPRPSSQSAMILRDIIETGRLVVYETDDLLTDLPDFNPAKMLIHLNEWHYSLIRKCHGCIVSTEELGQQLMAKDKTFVVHNGIDPEVWRMKAPEQDVQNVRVLWAGSDTHEDDLKLVVEPILRLIKKYPKKLTFVFLGYLPEAFKALGYREGKYIPLVKPEYAKNIQFAPGCPVAQWPAHLAQANCHIAIAPLVKHPFNESKSEIKVLEAWALGLPIVASDCAPYRRAITHRIDGALVTNNNLGDWERELDRLILDHRLRESMGAAGLASLKSKHYLMADVVVNLERALLKIASGRIPRTECEEAMAARLKVVG